jgi:hypothetical protein
LSEGDCGSSLRSRIGRGEIALAVVSVVVALAAGELATRVLRLAEPRPTGYAPVPTGRRSGPPMNSRGYRDRERALEKAPDVHRLLCLGDSFAWGVGVHFDDALPQRLERALTRRRRQTWEVVNLALPGLGTVDHAAQLQGEGFAYQPDAVLLAFVLNDAESRERMVAREREFAARAAAPPSPLGRFALYRFVAGRLEASQEARRRVAYHRGLYDEGTPDWVGCQKALREMGGACRERGVPLIVAIFPLFGNPLDAGYPFTDIHARVAAAATEAGADAVDLLPDYRGLRWELLVVDGVSDEHPNEIAHRIAADRLRFALDAAIPHETRP